MAKSLARTFGQDLMRGEHVVGGEKTNGGVLMPALPRAAHKPP